MCGAGVDNRVLGWRPRAQLEIKDFRYDIGFYGTEVITEPMDQPQRPTGPSEVISVASGGTLTVKQHWQNFGLVEIG